MTREELLRTLQEIGAEILGVDAAAITETAQFKDDLEADSLDLVEVVMALEERLDIAIPEEDLADITTVGQALDVVEGRIAARA
jgi:acyl carrier protein